MTKKQIIERLAEAGTNASERMTLAELEALAAEKGVSLEEAPDPGEARDKNVPAPEAAEYDPGVLMTPVMAVCGIAGGDAALPLPEAGAE